MLKKFSNATLLFLPARKLMKTTFEEPPSLPLNGTSKTTMIFSECKYILWYLKQSLGYFVIFLIKCLIIFMYSLWIDFFWLEIEYWILRGYLVFYVKPMKVYLLQLGIIQRKLVLVANIYDMYFLVAGRSFGVVKVDSCKENSREFYSFGFKILWYFVYYGFELFRASC